VFEEVGLVSDSGNVNSSGDSTVCTVVSVEGIGQNWAAAVILRGVPANRDRIRGLFLEDWLLDAKRCYTCFHVFFVAE